MRIIKYSSRILSIIIVAFFAMFILEGFDSEFGWQSGLMHGVLTLGVLGVTIISWKWPKIGGWLFVVFGIKYLFMIAGSQLLSGLLIGGVPILTGTLFLIDGFCKKR